jgi:hypothetical protein
MARNLGASGRIAEAEDRAVTIRPSSTANLVVDSLDREQYSSGGTSDNFIINKATSLFNGFFNRIAVAEIVLDWCIPNISAFAGNNTFTVTLSATTKTVTLPDGTYTVAEALDTLLALLNAATPGGFGAGTFRFEDQSGAAWVTGTSIGNIFLSTTAGTNFTIVNTDLSQQLGIAGTGLPGYPVLCPKLLPYYYIDFVSPQLTYNQDLKDNSTSSIVRDVLYRWVFAYDNGPIALDKYGYAILQGYKAFVSRRYLNFPKQIRWDSKMPLGQIGFQVYGSGGDLLNPTANGGEMEYQMTLMFSEN